MAILGHLGGFLWQPVWKGFHRLSDSGTVLAAAVTAGRCLMSSVAGARLLPAENLTTGTSMSPVTSLPHFTPLRLFAVRPVPKTLHLSLWKNFGLDLVVVTATLEIGFEWHCYYIQAALDIFFLLKRELRYSQRPHSKINKHVPSYTCRHDLWPWPCDAAAQLRPVGESAECQGDWAWATIGDDSSFITYPFHWILHIRHPPLRLARFN